VVTSSLDGAIDECRPLVKELRGRAAKGLVPAPPPVAANRKLFVVGCPRSGTTWVRDILAQHPLTITGPETHLYQDVFRPLRRRGVRRVRTWAEVLARYDENRRLGRTDRLNRWLGRDRLLDLVVRAMASTSTSDVEVAEQLVAEIYDAILDDLGAGPDGVLVDKTPTNLRWGAQILSQFGDAKLVEVLRDGRDVCVSMERLAADWAPVDRRTQIDRWLLAVNDGIALRADPRFAGRILLLRFEDLKADPPAQIGRLFDFAGLPWTAELLAAVAAATDFAAYAPAGEGFFHRKGVVGDWRNHFSPADEALFRDVVGDLFERAGYAY